MRSARSLLAFLLAAGACTSSPERPRTPPSRQASKATLASFCASSPCASSAETREAAATACSAPTSAVTRRAAKCGAFDVLIEDSELVTSSRYFDEAGKLVAVRVFSHEWRNRTDYGPIPECHLGALIDVCHYRGGIIATAAPPAAPTPSPTPAAPAPPTPTASAPAAAPDAPAP